MSCGLPVISTNLPPIAEFIDQKCGVLFQPNPNAISTAVIAIKDHFSTYEPEKMKSYIFSRFSENSVSHMFKQFYANDPALPFEIV